MMFDVYPRTHKEDDFYIDCTCLTFYLHYLFYFLCHKSPNTYYTEQQKQSYIFLLTSLNYRFYLSPRYLDLSNF